MRLWFAILAFGVMTDGACASSFVTLGDWQPQDQAAKAQALAVQEQSIRHLGDEQETAFPPVLLAYPLPSSGDASTAVVEVVSPSIIAFDPPAASVTFEQVAAIAPKPPGVKASHDDPVVIRGGIVGSGSAAAAPVTLPAPGKAAAKDGSKAAKAETKVNAAGQKVIVIDATQGGRTKGPAAPPKPAAPAVATPPREQADPQ